MHSTPTLHPLYLQSETMVLKHLRHLHPNVDSSVLYQSASKVAACTRQAVEFQRQAMLVSVALRPLLSYYAILHWMKTLLYLRDPFYPPSSSVLQHGLSLRRAKKVAYRWTLESVHVYKEGIMQSFCLLPGVQHQLPLKFVVGDVMGSLPGLSGTFSQLHQQFQHVFPVECKDGRFLVSRRIASNLALTVEEWRKGYMEHGAGGVGDLGGAARDPDGLLTLPWIHGHPWHRTYGDAAYIWDGPPNPEWVSHFVLLYSLSTLCRYNPVEWSDILTWSNETDALLVREYLERYPLDDICRGILQSGNGLESGKL